MRQLGTVSDERIAQRFADFLLTKGIPLSVDPAPGGWALWVRNEDHLDEARRQFAEFEAAPDAPIYSDAARTAEQLRAEEQRRAAAAKKNMVNVGKRWGQTRGASGARVTALLLGGSIAVAVFSNLGQDPAFVSRLTIDNFVPTIHGTQPELLWTHEPWRLVTPIFLHFGPMHILFNMLMLWQLGIPVERGIGSFRYLLLVLVIAIPSNFAEYIWDVQRLNEGVRIFGGMSGVLYGLFGYIWMKSRYEPQSGFMISSNTVIWMVGWFFLCLTGYLGNIANVVHGAGLVVGMIVGRFPSLWRSMR
ncbi:MAG TPA: rhomboid family intramembrane serine protease [Planctomycetaceae bacterium]|nr:rhomboid family intramembrane serine protease [Planctomycetaceae bacterium]